MFHLNLRRIRQLSFQALTLHCLLISAFSFLLSVPAARAQWVQTNGPAISVNSLAVRGSDLFAGSWLNGGVYRSTDNGTNWSEVDTGLTNKKILSIAVSGTMLFVGTDGGGVFRSTDSGASWTAINTGLTNQRVFTITSNATTLFVGTNSGVFVSTDSGINWTSPATAPQGYITSLGVNDSNTFAGTGDVDAHGVFRSTDNGTSWTAANAGIAHDWIEALAVTGKDLYVGESYGFVFHSSDNGSSWSSVRVGVPCDDIWALLVSGTNLFAGTDQGVFRSTDSGVSWKIAGTELKQHNVQALAVIGSNLFAGTLSGVWRRPLSEFSASVTNVSKSSSPIIELYPNPAGTYFQIQCQQSISCFYLLDLLGRRVLSSRIAGNDVLDVSELQTGRYEVVIHTLSGVMTAPVIIQH
jgi:photosystem II stability/assembly factor-like uncharacterized protein